MNLSHESFRALICTAFIAFFSTEGIAATVFVDDKPGFMSAISGSPTFALDLESGSLPAYSDPFSDQEITITNTGAGALSIAGSFFGTDPLSGSNQGALAVEAGGVHSIVFDFAQPTTIFGIHVGDMFDAAPTITYTLNTDTNSPFMVVSGGSPTGSNDTTTIPSSPSVSFTTGSTYYTFFGLVDTVPFQSVTLTMTDGGTQDNFVFDDLIVGAVPIPPAVWLFGSGLLGIIGVARRRRVA